MANYFTLTLDTTGPASPSLDLGGTTTANQLINTTIGTGDGTTTGYEMKFWGDIDIAWAKSNGIVPAGFAGASIAETDALWIGYATSKQLKLSSGDASKAINMKLRDDVHNESALVTKNITLDTTIPTVTITGGKADRDRIATNTDISTAIFSFTSSEDFSQYKVCYVTSGGIDQASATIIGTANGSIGTTGNAGNYKANTQYNVTLKGLDIKAISSPDGDKFIKVFVQDMSGQWSA
jgi:hypothetical protein